MLSTHQAEQDRGHGLLNEGSDKQRAAKDDDFAASTTGAGPDPSKDTAGRYVGLHDNMILNLKDKLTGDSVDDRHVNDAIDNHKQASRNFSLAADAFSKNKDVLGNTYLDKAGKYHERAMRQSKKLGLVGRLNDKGGSTIL